MASPFEIFGYPISNCCSDTVADTVDKHIFYRRSSSGDEGLMKFIACGKADTENQSK